MFGREKEKTASRVREETAVLFPESHGSVARSPTASMSIELTAFGDTEDGDLQGDRDRKTDRDDDQVHFMVGTERQLVTASKRRLSAVSPVFDVMFHGPWRTEQVIDIPDVHPSAFFYLLRYAAGEDTTPALTESLVWNVLRAADKYEVRAVVARCFRFLLRSHPRRRRGRHLCSVLETAHRLHYPQEHQECLLELQRHAATILKGRTGLSLLCPSCLCQLIQADDLGGVDEMTVHRAVVTWARWRCLRRRRCNGMASDVTSEISSEEIPAMTSELTSEPTWEELRTEAGGLLRHVRYLTLPRATLTLLLKPAPPKSSSSSWPCLLTKEEINDLMKHQGSQFPDTVGRARKRKERKKHAKGPAASTKRRYVVCCTVITVILLLTFLAQYLFARFLISPLLNVQEPVHPDPPEDNCGDQTLCRRKNE